jgi:hypothetical protein
MVRVHEIRNQGRVKGKDEETISPIVLESLTVTKRETQARRSSSLVPLGLLRKACAWLCFPSAEAGYFLVVHYFFLRKNPTEKVFVLA